MIALRHNKFHSFNPYTPSHHYFVRLRFYNFLPWGVNSNSLGENDFLKTTANEVASCRWLFVKNKTIIPVGTYFKLALCIKLASVVWKFCTKSLLLRRKCTTYKWIYAAQVWLEENKKVGKVKSLSYIEKLSKGLYCT